jgi:hypothetical protein
MPLFFFDLSYQARVAFEPGELWFDKASASRTLGRGNYYTSKNVAVCGALKA